MTCTNTVWVITREINEYDQYGEYFVGVFSEKPTIATLMSELQVSEEYAIHVYNKGGRKDTEWEWYTLSEEPLLDEDGAVIN